MKKKEHDSGVRILVVDDDPLIRMNMEKLLQKEGYNVISEDSGENARKRLSETSFDLVVTDLVMEKITGLDVLAYAKERYPDIVVIMLTGFADMKTAISAIRLGADDFMLKPAESEEIFFRVKRCLENRDLKIRIDQRTRELEALNKQLKKDISQRKRAETKLQKANYDLIESLAKLKIAQDKLIQSEKLASLGGMVSGIVHEINTPIGIGITASTFIKQLISKIEKGIDNGQVDAQALGKFLRKSEEAASIIHSNLARAGSLLENFKQVSVDQVSEKPRKILVDEYLHEVISSLSVELKRSSHRIIVNCPQNLLFDSRPGALAQIITNFVMNAVNHGFEGMTGKEIRFDIVADDNSLYLTCRDNGKGMKKEDLRQIFDPFYTTKREKGGTGLGLYVVYNLVTKALSGTIECVSEEGVGTEFRVKVPLNGR